MHRSCCPPCKSLIHGNFEGAAQKKAYALVGAAAAIAAAVGPLLGGFLTTYLSWRIAFLLEVVIIAIVLSGIRLVRDAPYTGPRDVDAVGAALSVLGMGGIVLGILVWQEGGESVAALLAVGAMALAALSTGLAGVEYEIAVWAGLWSCVLLLFVTGLIAAFEAAHVERNLLWTPRSAVCLGGARALRGHRALVRHADPRDGCCVA